MGDVKDNHYLMLHRQADDLKSGYMLRYHLGIAHIDVEVLLTTADFEALHQAAWTMDSAKLKTAMQARCPRLCQQLQRESSYTVYAQLFRDFEPHS